MAKGGVGAGSGAGALKRRDGSGVRTTQKSKDVRLSNITAAKGVADAVRTSLGPRGMDKMIEVKNGEVLITNDGATILQRMNVQHPAAKMLVDLSKSQDIEAGDGTTSVVVIAGALLSASLSLLDMGIHPTIISQGFQTALDKAVTVLSGMAVPVDLNDRETLLQAASTSLNSKVVSQYSSLLAPIAVDSVLRVKRADANSGGFSVDLNDVRTVKKVGGTIDDCELVDGLVLTQECARSAGGPTRISGAKVALCQFQISPPKTDVENSVVVQDYNSMDRILKEERQHLLQMVKKIKASGANVLLIQKSILRDAVTDLSLHFLAKVKIMVITDVERSEIEFISKSLGCTPVASVDALTADKLAKVDLVEEVTLSGEEKVVRLTGIQNAITPTSSILVRGSNNLVLDEAERSLHDALCVIRSLVRKQFMIAGGSAPEVEMAIKLAQYSKELSGMESHCVRAYADALEVVPYTLAENAGLSPVEIVTELRRRHALGEYNTGINVKKGRVTDILEENVKMPLLVIESAMRLATECVRLLLRIDDVVLCR
ncbi:T-complex protein 1 subunit delta [Porphyridium purpureum]|uniref:T-complex protein 1 subunit delta n=1 Tax=Porphyridium purpureum TaxID=35688 RepID=A0A5J4YX97_PORPP|nr:T-complex protein 1 subunit delta [Porphyridium purpureum]|eukprot:POR3546..scf209_3